MVANDLLTITRAGRLSIMNHSDKQEFKTLFDGISEYYGKSKLSKMALQIYFGALEKYAIEDITTAASVHLQDTEGGKFYPKAADLIKHMSGGELKADDIVAAARLADTPLGILARIHIGTWDLDNLNSFDLRQRAAECLQLLPEWKSRGQAGDYTDHEISIMVKHEVNPSAPFSIGFARPQNALELDSRVRGVVCTDRHKQLVAPPYVEHEGQSKLMAPEIKDRLVKDLAIAGPKDEAGE
jgi:hypothetical protein